MLTHILILGLPGHQVGTVFDPVALEHVEATPATAAGNSGRDMAVRARAASRALQALPTSERVAMLERVADSLVAHQDEILAENAKDMEEAQVGVRTMKALGQVNT